MAVEVFVHEYNKWIPGTVTSISSDDGEIMIVLDPKSDKLNVGWITIKQYVYMCSIYMLCFYMRLYTSVCLYMYL